MADCSWKPLKRHEMDEKRLELFMEGDQNIPSVSRMVVRGFR
jgi:hypothetical protein